MESEVSNKREQREGLNRTPQKQSRQYDYTKTKYQENSELTRVLARPYTASGKCWKQEVMSHHITRLVMRCSLTAVAMPTIP